jgi:hypothetical protein
VRALASVDFSPSHVGVNLHSLGRLISLRYGHNIIVAVTVTDAILLRI